MNKPTERFTETVQDYIKYRPSYPAELLQVLIKECNLTKESIIADIGSGTGFLSQLFLDNGNMVYGVEPNPAMRAAGEEILSDYPNFISVNATAEKTTLSAQSIDIITAGTAFHWFDVVKTKIEFARIIKKGGWVVLIWNVRDKEESPLLQDYENLIMKYGTDYMDSRASKFDKTVVQDFFSPYEMKTAILNNRQLFDWTGLQGRLLSASYSLRPGDERYQEMMDNLYAIFNQHQKNGIVEFLYKTKLYFGHIAG